MGQIFGSLSPTLLLWWILTPSSWCMHDAHLVYLIWQCGCQEANRICSPIPVSHVTGEIHPSHYWLLDVVVEKITVTHYLFELIFSGLKLVCIVEIHQKYIPFPILHSRSRWVSRLLVLEGGKWFGLWLTEDNTGRRFKKKFNSPNIRCFFFFQDRAIRSTTDISTGMHRYWN